MRILLTLMLDLVAVVVFAAIGRASHAEGSAILGVLGTAWPFAAGVLAGTVISLVLGRRLGATWAVPAGIAVWIAAVVVGMVLRAASGRGTPTAFVVVATISLAVLLLGWRLVALAARRVRATRSSPTAPSLR